MNTNFGQALETLKEGGRVTRSAWVLDPVPGFPFVYLVPGSRFTVEAERPMGQAAPELVGKTVDYSPHIDIMSAEHQSQPWTPTTADLLAEDWITVD